MVMDDSLCVSRVWENCMALKCFLYRIVMVVVVVVKRIARIVNVGNRDLKNGGRFRLT